MIGLLASFLAALAAPNVVLITVDTLRADHLGAYGYGPAETPVLDRLAREGVLVEEAVAQVPQTRPSHASILTGPIPTSTGSATTTRRPSTPRWRRWPVLEAPRLRHRRLHRCLPGLTSSGLDRGFDVYDDPFGAGERSTTRDPRLERNAASVVGPALAWMARPRTAPFFAWLHLFDPHAPYEAPAPYGARFRERPYDGEIAYVDAQLGRVVEWLDRSGARSSTLVVVTADHGESLGEHGEDEHMIFVYDATLRVPLVLSWPGRLPAGARVKGQFRSVDLLPTVLDLVGAPSVPTSGASRAPYLADGRRLPDNESYAESLYGQIHFGWAPLRALRGEGYKLIEAPRPELFRLAEDPGEIRNLVQERRPLAQGMRSRLALYVARDAGPRLTAGADPAALERLAALGYVGGGTFEGKASGADPKDRISAYQNRRREILRGLRLFRDRDLEAAIRVLAPLSSAAGADAADDEPERRSFNVEYYLGRSLVELGRFKEAVPPLKVAVAAAPASVPARIFLAQALSGSGQAASALAALDEALRRAPNNPELLQATGALLLRTGDPTRAEVALEKALALDSTSVNLHVDLAALHRGRGDLRRARREVEAALRLDPQSAPARVEKALLLGALGDERGAARELQEVLEGSPRHADALYYLAALERRAGRAQEERDLLERLARTSPDYPGVRAALAEARRVLAAAHPAFRLRLLRVSDRARGEDAWRRTQGGEDFEALARSLSEGPSAEGGDDLGEVYAVELAEPLRRAAQTLRPGETSPPLESPGGFVLLHRVD